ncbi:MAG: hypothetical protein LBQ12_01420 [Deltaproteobacteria bacterium]|nr:hypothetical protein [Deltaproteobacteria bacterium]
MAALSKAPASGKIALPSLMDLIAAERTGDAPDIRNAVDASVLKFASAGSSRLWPRCY